MFKIVLTTLSESIHILGGKTLRTEIKLQLLSSS